MNAILKNEQGAALLAVLVVSTVLALVGTSYLSTSTHDAGLVTEQVQDVQALYAAESGIEYARRRLITWSEWGSDWTVPSLNTGAGVTAAVSFNSTTRTITSNSTIDGHTKTISLIVTPIKDSPFNQGACGCGSITLSNNASTNSYEYDGETYTPSNLGDIASNGDIDLAKAFVGGNVIAAGDGAGDDLIGHDNCQVTGTATVKVSVGSNLTEGEGGNIVGGITINPNMEDPCDCNAIDLTSLVNSAINTNNNTAVSAYLTDNDFNISTTGEEVTFAPGTYYFTSFNAANNVTINIPTDGQVIIVLSGPLVLNNGVTFNSNNNTNNLRIYSDSSAAITLENNAYFAGAIYAPSAVITLKQNTQVYGSLLGQQTNLEENAALYYDSSLLEEVEPDEVGVTEVTVQTSSWGQN